MEVLLLVLGVFELLVLVLLWPWNRRSQKADADDGVDEKILLHDRDPPGGFFLPCVLAIVRLEAAYTGLDDPAVLRIVTLVHLAEFVIFAKRQMLVHNNSPAKFFGCFVKPEHPGRRKDAIVTMITFVLALALSIRWGGTQTVIATFSASASATEN